MTAEEHAKIWAEEAEFLDNAIREGAQAGYISSNLESSKLTAMRMAKRYQEQATKEGRG